MGAVWQKWNAAACYWSSYIQLTRFVYSPHSSLEVSKYSSLYSEFQTVFPRFAAQQCVKLLLVDSSLSPTHQMELFTAYFLFLSPSTETSPVSTVSTFLQNASDPITSELASPSLESLLRSIRFIHTALHAVISFLQASESYSIFASHFPSLSSSWRQDNQEALISLLQDWTKSQIAHVTTAASTVVSAILTISSLAKMKRQTSSLLESLGTCKRYLIIRAGMARNTSVLGHVRRPFSSDVRFVVPEAVAGIDCTVFRDDAESYGGCNWEDVWMGVRQLRGDDRPVDRSSYFWCVFWFNWAGFWSLVTFLLWYSLEMNWRVLWKRKHKICSIFCFNRFIKCKCHRRIHTWLLLTPLLWWKPPFIPFPANILSRNLRRNAHRYWL